MVRAVRLVVCLLLVGCGGLAAGRVTAPSAPKLARWKPFVHMRRPLDVLSGLLIGSLTVEAAGRLWSVQYPGGGVTPLDPAYRSPGGEEPYIAEPGVFTPPGYRGCTFGGIYAIRLAGGRGVVRIAGNRVTRFASITAPGLIDGIAFDATGSFGHRLLVTINHGSTTTVDAIGCHGRVDTLTASSPRVEGGIAVAPRTFGRFGGDLIAPDETGGRIFAITPRGRSALVADSGLPHGGDIGVESEAFVPDDRNARFFVADRLTPGNRHPGDDALLEVSYKELRAAGVRPFDLLVATEGGAFTDAIRCGATSCAVRHVADGPSEAHVEGHIAFVP